MVASETHKRCVNLSQESQAPRFWIDEKGLKAARERPGREFVWVKGHSGIEGNEQADRRVKHTVMRGQLLSEPSLVTPAGIRQAYPLFRKERHMKWDRDELRGLTYLHKDRGPMRSWLY